MDIRRGVQAVKKIVRTIEGADNILDNDVRGRYELTLELDYRAVREAGLDPGSVARLLRLHLDGEDTGPILEKTLVLQEGEVRVEQAGAT